MSFTSSGLIQQLLDFLGVTITTSDGYYLVYISALILAITVVIITFFGLFKFLVYLRKN